MRAGHARFGIGPVLIGAALMQAVGLSASWAAAEPSRDVRSAAYCSKRANLPGFYDTEAAIACRREEYSAAARVRSLEVPPDIDEYCESLAAEGDPVGPFSWAAYLACVDLLLP